jgi:hypothetical protein
VTGPVDVRTLVSPEIYRGLFPATFGTEGERAAAATTDVAREGLQIGPVHLRPSIVTSYVNGEYTLLDTPDPVRDRYLQIEPRVVADMPLFGGELTADYAARLRFFSQFDEINSTSHLLDTGFELPLGSRAMVRVRDHFSTGVLEATEVDPGQEYFFDLSRFHRNEIEVGARVEAGSRVFLDGARLQRRFDDASGASPTPRRAAVWRGSPSGPARRPLHLHIPPPPERTWPSPPRTRSAWPSTGISGP